MPRPSSSSNTTETSSNGSILEPLDIEIDGEDSTTSPQSRRRPLSWQRMGGLTSILVGVQTFWSILMAHGTPYLRRLGLSESLTSIVWMAGPLAAALLSPVIGSWSDRLAIRSSFVLRKLGRRKPLIIVGAIGVAFCLWSLAHVRGILEVLLPALGLVDADVTLFGERGIANSLLAVAAIFCVYALVVFVTALQVGARAFIVDCVDSDQQQDISAWVSRWACLAAVNAFWLSSIDLPALVPALGSAQFVSLCNIELVLLAVTVPVSLGSGVGREKQQQSTPPPSRTGLLQRVWQDLVDNSKKIPPVIRDVFKIQLWAWNGWFPFLYYHTSWVGDLASSSETHLPNHISDAEATQAARIGSFAGFLYALAALIFTLLLPPVSRYCKPLTVERLWFLSHAAFAISMFLTLFANTVALGTVLMTAAGFSWAMTQWAPFSLIAFEIVRSGEEVPTEASRDHDYEYDEREDAEKGVRQEEEIEDGQSAVRPDDAQDLPQDSSRHKPRHSNKVNDSSRQKLGVGAILGLHNVIMAAPQVVAAVEVAILFKVLDGLGVHDKSGWALRVAGMSALGAMWSCRRMLSWKSR